LAGEYQRVMQYQQQRKASLLKPMSERYRNAIDFILSKKQQQLATLQSKAQVNNPELSTKKGWAQVIKNGTPVDLEDIEAQEEFVLQNGGVKLTALALKKEGMKS